MQKNAQDGYILFSWSAAVEKSVCEILTDDVNLLFAKPGLIRVEDRLHFRDNPGNTDEELEIVWPQNNDVIQTYKSITGNIRTSAYIVPLVVNMGSVCISQYGVYGVSEISKSDLLRVMKKPLEVEGLDGLSKDDVDHVITGLISEIERGASVERSPDDTDLSGVGEWMTGEPTTEPADVAKVFDKMEKCLNQILRAPSKQTILANWERPKVKGFRNTAGGSPWTRPVSVPYGDEIITFTLGVTKSGTYWAKKGVMKKGDTAPHWIFKK